MMHILNKKLRAKFHRTFMYGSTFVLICLSKLHYPESFTVCISKSAHFIQKIRFLASDKLLMGANR